MRSDIAGQYSQNKMEKRYNSNREPSKQQPNDQIEAKEKGTSP